MSTLHRRGGIWGDLAGDRIVRIIHLDDAGLANVSHEPYVVIAGTIMHADRNWKEIEGRLLGLADLHVPREKLADLVAFSAKELVHGGKIFSREQFHARHRVRILKKILAIPAQYGLPVVYGISDRRERLSNSHIANSQKGRTHLSYHIAYMTALIRANEWMKKHAPDEVAMVVAEDNTEMRSGVAFTHQMLQSYPYELSEKFRQVLPLDKIIEAPNFSQKDPSSPLQTADALAYAIKRVAMKRNHSAELAECFHEQILREPSLEGDPFIGGEPTYSIWSKI